jgi:dTDP-glucose 4,6-dehydratase
MRFLVTGGSGFLGSHFVKTVLQDEKNFVVNMDRLDPCSTKTMCESTDRYVFARKDLNDEGAIAGLIMQYDMEMVVHFAAQSHVDSSFTCSRSHVIDNVLGVHSLLEALRKCHPLNGVRCVMISSDEIYGSSEGDEAKTEESSMNASSPYSCSKACGELLCNTYVHSFKLPIAIVRGNNALGPYQFFEKCIPRFIKLLSEDRPITIQGGSQRRSFIHASDFVSAVLCVMEKGDFTGKKYNVGSKDEITIIDLARTLARMMKKPLKIDYVEDRHFNDSRYLICAKRLAALGWVQKIDFEQGLQETIDWYLSDAAKDYFMSEYSLPELKLVPPPVQVHQ